MCDLVLFVQLKKCEKHLWSNATFSKFAGLHYSWKYHIGRNVNSFYCNYILIVGRINRRHQSRTFTFQKKLVICFIQSSLKNDQKCFLFDLKNFSFMIFKFLSSLFVIMLKERLDQKDKVNFKIHDITTWLTNNYNTYITLYLAK